MRFAHKVALVPAFAGLSFLVVLTINVFTGSANARLMSEVQKGYLPALELSRGAETDLAEVQQTLQDAAAARDLVQLGRADVLREALSVRLRAGRATEVFGPGEIASLEAQIGAYYETARNTAVRAIDGEKGATLQAGVDATRSAYASLAARLRATTERQRAEMDDALEAVRRNHARSARIMTVALVLGLLAMGLVSRALIRSTVGALRGALAAASAESGEASGPFRRRAGDEIAQLLASLQKATAALAARHRQLGEAQRLAHFGSWEWDAVRRRGSWSDELQRIFGVLGHPPTTFEGFLALVHPDDRERVRSLTETAHATHEPFAYRSRIVRPDGTVRALLSHNEVVVDAAGAMVGTRGVTQDVTEEEATAAALRASEERYRLLFEDNPQPMCVYETDTLRLLAVNGALVDHYGYSSAELLEMSVADVFQPEERDTLLQNVSLAAAVPGIKRSGVWRHRRKDGRAIEVEVASHAIEFGARPARLVLVVDVTEKRLLEEQARQSQKMEAVGRLAGGVAHDFNNILGVIIGYGEIVHRRLPAGDALQGKVAEILKAAERAAGLTRQLLAFSRKQVLQPRVLDLNAVVSDMDRMLRRLIGEDVELSTSLREPLGSVLADAGQIEQVLVNLVVNARDAMPGTGSLAIETADVVLDAAYVTRHPGASSGPHVVLSVSDTGHGMDASTVSRIFEPFFTTKPLGQGTGLGLSTVIGIVEQSGGHVSVDTEPGRGTTFRVYLPRIEAEVTPEAERSALRPPTGAAQTVLLVEDEAALRGMIAETLEQGGYRVLDAASPRQALDAALAHDGPIHAVLTDVVMPGMSGRELAQRLLELRPHARVVYMSGYTDDAIGHHGLLEPGTFFLQKPFTADAILWKLHDAIAAA